MKRLITILVLIICLSGHIELQAQTPTFDEVLPLFDRKLEIYANRSNQLTRKQELFWNSGIVYFRFYKDKSVLMVFGSTVTFLDRLELKVKESAYHARFGTWELMKLSVENDGRSSTALWLKTQPVLDPALNNFDGVNYDKLPKTEDGGFNLGGLPYNRELPFTAKHIARSSELRSQFVNFVRIEGFKSQALCQEILWFDSIQSVRYLPFRYLIVKSFDENMKPNAFLTMDEVNGDVIAQPPTRPSLVYMHPNYNGSFWGSLNRSEVRYPLLDQFETIVQELGSDGLEKIKQGVIEKYGMNPTPSQKTEANTGSKPTTPPAETAEEKKKEQVRVLITASAKIRKTLVDSSGQFSIDAVVIAIREESVDLMNYKTKEKITIKFSQLSLRDQEWIKSKSDEIKQLGEVVYKAWQALEEETK